MHVDEYEGFDFLSPDMEALGKLIDEGEVPVLCLEDRQGQKMLEVRPHRPWIEYTAISHVWADGLGNLEANALPRCQVERLLAYFNSLPWTKVRKFTGEDGFDDSTWSALPLVEDSDYTDAALDAMRRYFWIDTLCTPFSGQAYCCGNPGYAQGL